MLLSPWFISAAQAHEKWFVTGDVMAYPQPESFHTWNAMTIVGAVAVIFACVVGAVLDRLFERSGFYEKLERRIRFLRDYAAFIMSFAVGVLLLWSAADGVVLVDNAPLPLGILGTLLRGFEMVIGLCLIVGVYTRMAAIGLGVIFASLFLLLPGADAFDYLYFAGIAGFLFYFARGRYSLDWFAGKPILSSAEERKRAYFVLRILTGVSFIILAAGKWLRPDLHLLLMDAHPNFNPYVIAQAVGFSWLSRETYVFLLFIIELTVGLFVLTGMLTRIAAIALMPVFTGSILFLGAGELVGHLPILGILLVLFVFGDTYHKGGVKERKTPS
jgi:uncharacterized membrane protein YphA (DoxX/SURF4 family)